MSDTMRLDAELLNFDSARRPIKASERVAGDVPYLGASGEVDRVEGFTHDGDYLCVSEDGENLRSRNTPIAWVQRGKFWANNHVHVLGGLPMARLRFYEAALALLPVSSYLTGSAQPKLTQSALRAITVPHRTAQEQSIIGEILGALDDKIAANDRLGRSADRLIRARYLNLSESNSRLGDIATPIREPIGGKNIGPTFTYVGLEHLDQRSIWLKRRGLGDQVTSTKIRFRQAILYSED